MIKAHRPMARRSAIKRLPMLIIGAFFLIAGGMIFEAALQEEQKLTSITNGIVIGYRQKTGTAEENFQLFYAPIVRYETEELELCTATGNVWRTRKSFPTGTSVTIRYNPAQPEKISLDFSVLSVGMRLGLVLFLIGGALCLLWVILRLGQKNSCDAAAVQRKQAQGIALLITALILTVWCLLAGIQITLTVFVLLGLAMGIIAIKKRRKTGRRSQ